MPGSSTNSINLLSQLNFPLDPGVSSGSHFLQPEALQTVLEVSSYKNSASSSLVDEALQSTETQLRSFATDPAFTDKMNLAFGTDWDVNAAKDFAQSWLNGGFSALPTIEIRSGSEINEANGAFAAKTNTIYLSSDFLSQNARNSGAVTAVLLEEIGHAIDLRINKTDAAGDEGDIFSRLVRGEQISASELLELKADNDHAVISINGQSFDIEMSQIGMTSLNNVLYQSHQGTNNQIYTRSTKDGVNWTTWNNNGGGSTYSAPALTTLDGKIYQAHRGTDNKIYTHSSADGVNWSAWNNNGGGETYSAPAMAMLNSNIYQAHRGTDNNLYIRSSTDGVNWTKWNSNGGGSTYSAPALATLDGKLYESHRGTDNKIYTRWTTNGTSWTAWNNNGGGETASAPALAVFNGKLYQTHRGTNNKVYTRSSSDGTNWNGWSNVGDGETPDAPSLVASNGRLYQSHQGMNNKIYTCYTTNGTNWTAWTENGGLTPTEGNSSGDRLTQLAQKPGILSSDEIREYRQLVNQHSESERNQWYRTLQDKTDYFNQRNNKSEGIREYDGKYGKLADEMCNLTALANSLTYLGVKNRNPSMQFEDTLEKYRKDNKLGAKTNWTTLAKIAEDFGAKPIRSAKSSGTTKGSYDESMIRSSIDKGSAVILSVKIGVLDHIVRVQGYDSTGFIVDDPYGKARLNAKQQSSYATLNSTSSDSTTEIGSNNKWTWAETKAYTKNKGWFLVMEQGLI